MRNRNYFPRDLYFSQIEPFVGKGLIKVLTGQRRVGKSYLLFQVMDTINKLDPEAEIIYIDKEDYQFDAIRTYNDLMGYLKSARKKSGKCYLFIDEIQDIANFEIALRSLQDDPDWDIYCTGSNATLLSGELATYLAGRFIQIRIYALTYLEYLRFHQLTDGSESFLNYIKYGGMPYLVNLQQDDRIVYEYLSNVLDTIVLRDVVSRYNVRNIHFLRDLIHYLGDSVGSIVSAKRISDYLKSQQINLSPKLVLEYLSYLESVYFFDRVQRAEIGGKKIFEIGDKFYFEDLGMRHSIIPFQQKDIGKVLENVVYHHLKANGYKVYVGKDGVKEIDFVAEKNGNKTYIQVSYMLTEDKTHDREFGNLLAIQDNFPKMVVSMDEMATGNFKGIYHLTIRKLLLEFN
jgi:predicted AAA+ superfamily ATPase